MVTLASKPRLCAAPEQLPSVPVRDQLLPAASHAFCAASPFGPNSKTAPPTGAAAGFLAAPEAFAWPPAPLATVGLSSISSRQCTLLNPPPSPFWTSVQM